MNFSVNVFLIVNLSHSNNKIGRKYPETFNPFISEGNAKVQYDGHRGSLQMGTVAHEEPVVISIIIYV